MTELHKDPRLTAYALGELEPHEAAVIDAHVESDPTLQQVVDSIRATGEQLTQELRAEAGPALTDAQRENIERGGEPLNHPSIFTTRRLMVAGSIAAAACVFIAFGVMMMPDNNDRFGENVAIGNRNQSPTSPAEAATERERAASLESLRAETRDSRAALAAPDASRAAGGAAGSTSGPVPTGEQPRPTAAEPKGQGSRPGTGSPPPPSEPARRRAPARERTAPGDNIDSAVRTITAAEVGQAVDREDDGRGRTRGFADRFDADEQFNREGFDVIVENEFRRPDPVDLSTFSIDVDTASYTNVRRMLMSENRLPPPGAVRLEEFTNYFDYLYAPPAADDAHPFAVHVEVGPAPWESSHKLVRIGLKGYEVDPDMRPATNIVFLLDVSGSMRPDNKLPLVKESMKKLVEQLNGDDRLAIVTYAGNAGIRLDSTYVQDKEAILAAIDSLSAGGSTNGAGGINVAYEVAQKHFIEGGVNRVILCTDGDFNVGASSDAELVKLIEEKRESDVFLSIFGFGVGNFQDGKMEKLSNAGNGTFGYIDTAREADRQFVEKLSSTLVAIAKDVKVQVDFNPAKVGAYRLIGYENRMLAAEDFLDDTKDAGEINAGHTVTALYEIIPVGAEADIAEVPEKPQSRFFEQGKVIESDLLLSVAVAYKKPEADESTNWLVDIDDAGTPLEETSDDFRFAAAVASFGMLLRDSEFSGDATYASVLDLAQGAVGAERNDSTYRNEFLQLVERAQALSGQ